MSDRIARLEATIEFHEKRIEGVENSVGELRNHISDLSSEVAALEAKMDSLREEIKQSNKRNMWLIGLYLTVLNIVVGVIIHFV